MKDGTMNGGEVIVATLLSRDIDTVFFVPGGTYVTVLEALSRVQNKIRSIPTRLESSAAFACDAYAGITRKPACMFVSRAPGASNAVIGVHTAMQASRPFVLFIADIPKAQKGREAFQEVEYKLMFEPVAKAVLEVNSYDELAKVTARAIDLSVSGRPGPVVCVVSKDLLDGKTGNLGGGLGFVRASSPPSLSLPLSLSLSLLLSPSLLPAPISLPLSLSRPRRPRRRA